MSGGGLTAAGLIVVLLAFIGIGVGIYYAYICLRARPVRPRQHTDCEEGPLIADPDVNGNHEDVPAEASAPVDDDTDSKAKALPDDHHIDDKIKAAPPESNGPVDEVTSRPEKEEIFIPIEAKPEPAKLTHEKETAEVLNHIAPVGFVAPIVHFRRNGTPIHQESPTKGEYAKQEKAAPEVHHPINSPVPVFVPVSGVGKKPVTDSDEEDGLLLQKCSPHDDSLEPVACSDVSVPLKEEIQVHNASTSTSKTDQGASDENIPNISEKQSLAAEQNLGDSSENIVPKAAQPLESYITVAVAPDYGWQKEPPPGEAKNSCPNDASKDKHQPMLMKEEVENLIPVEEISILEKELEKPESVVKLQTQNLKAPLEGNNQIGKIPEILVNAPSDANICHPGKGANGVVPNVAEYPEVVYLETSKPYPSEKDSDSSDSSDEEISSQTKPISPNNPASLSYENNDSTDRKCEEQADCKPEVSVVSEITFTSEGQKILENSSSSPEESDAEDSVADVPLKDNISIPVDSKRHEPSIHHEASGPKIVPLELQMKSVVSEEAIESTYTLENIHESSTDVPLEAEGPYYGEPIDTLAVIKEESSMDADSENTDTDTSEPEVTQYTFSEESPATSTTNILADEISSTLEPEVTKYSLISELDVSENSELESPVPKEEKPTVDGHSENAVSIKADPKGSEDLANVSVSKKPDTSDSSASESEGEEAEPEVKEESIIAPSVVKNQSLDAARPLSEAPAPDENNSSVTEVCKADLNRNSTEQVSLVTTLSTPQSTDTTSSSSSASSESEFSDEEVTPASPTKSKIPRLVERNGS